MNTRNIQIPLIVCCIYLATFLSLSIKAVEIDSLYDAKVALQPGNDNQNQAYQQAFTQVLVKLAGREFVGSNPVIKTGIRNAKKYLSAFSFENNQGQNFLFASFEAAKVDSLLQQSNAPIWGKHRPLITIWMIDEQGINRELIDDSHAHLSQYIKQAFDRRGIRVNFPLMDLTDAMAVSANDIWGRFSDNLQSASNRYMAEAVMVLRVSDSSLVEEPDIAVCGNLCEQQTLAADWSLWSDNLFLQNKLSDNNKDILLQQLVDNAADALHRQYSFVVSNQNRSYVDIEVANVASMSDYIAVSKLFENLSLVGDVTLIQVDGQQMLFRLQTVADSNTIMQALSLESSLQLNQDPLAAPNKQQPVSFFWKG